MIETHINKLKKANNSISQEEIYKNYKEQRKNTIDSAIVDKKTIENIIEMIENGIKKYL